MESEIQEYLDLGLIRPSTTPWASPVLMIRKRDGGIRFCIDYRKLNAVTVKDSYPMPLIDDILDVLGNAKLFSTLDTASGYWNVPMDPDSAEKTGFTSKFGLYEWLVMPFGLCNAVPAFGDAGVITTNMIRARQWYLDEYIYENTNFLTGKRNLSYANPDGTPKRFQPADFVGKVKLGNMQQLLPKMYFSSFA
ncbi:hypothetical protein PC118_g23956 [Phytophthora cactorum]|uniref:Reverse transcriptase domain-containing protein n=1 Tax=Phytophthora cactorum TaxID=29920 RepID=A0A8T1EVD5_9STRA|nr:hypothetical protein PC118_g23956 [Phytophthora cactorum]